MEAESAEPRSYYLLIRLLTILARTNNLFYQNLKQSFLEMK